jgi:hypothetical protein
LSRAPLFAAKKAIESFSSQEDASTAHGFSAIRESLNSFVVKSLKKTVQQGRE